MIRQRPARIGLALGSGSARGWAHFGIIEALHKEGIRPDVVCGTSIGALVGAAYVCGRFQAFENWIRSLNWFEMARLLDFRLNNGGLIEGERLVRVLRDLHDDPDIEDLPLPFIAVATDLTTGREVWLRDGSLMDAVRASMALPGVMSPVPYGDGQLVDGGLVNPVPVAPCRALGAEVIIAVNLNGELVGRRAQKRMTRSTATKRDFLERVVKELPDGWRGSFASQLMTRRGGRANYFDVIFSSINVMQDRITRSRMAGDPPDILLAPKIGHIGLLEFNRAEEAIEEGRAIVAQNLSGIRDVLARAGHQIAQKQT